MLLLVPLHSSTGLASFQCVIGCVFRYALPQSPHPQSRQLEKGENALCDRQPGDVYCLYWLPLVLLFVPFPFSTGFCSIQPMILHFSEVLCEI